jgi:hypothetical protein
VPDQDAPTAWKNPMAWLPFSIAEFALSGGDGDDRFVDVSFADLQTDSVKTVADSYEKRGLEFSDAARDKVRQWADGNKPGQRGTHNYELADYGLTQEQVHEAFAEYLATYDASA